MKLKLSYILIVSCSLFFLISCYRIEDAVINSFTVDKKELNFNAKGGTETVHLLRRGLRGRGKKIREREIDWTYMGCTSPKPYFDDKVDMKVDTLTDGTVKIHNEWIAFSSPKNRKTIQIEVKENTTGEDRIILFDVSSLAVGFTLTVKQSK